ncbi:hypothetical protein AltI4_13650 [Alteromonas sp. I4]|nr:hypothetical protein AltI4_13650 [Alteromonas sp. I4]
MAFQDDYLHHVINSKLFSDPELAALCSRQLLDSHTFYINLTNLISPAYPKLATEQYDAITWVSYSLLRTLLSIDRVVDEGKIDHLKFALFNQETATRGLVNLFGESTLFWNSYDHIKKLFFNTIEQEKILHKSTNLNKQIFINIAKHKSIFVTLIPHMLGEMSLSNDKTKQINDSLLALHAGIQMLDDIEDFQADLENNQLTYAAWLTQCFLERHSIDFRTVSHKDMMKYFAASGSAFRVLDLAEHQFNCALRHITSLKLLAYEEYIQHIGLQQVNSLRASLLSLLSRKEKENANA